MSKRFILSVGGRRGPAWGSETTGGGPASVMVKCISGGVVGTSGNRHFGISGADDENAGFPKSSKRADHFRNLIGRYFRDDEFLVLET